MPRPTRLPSARLAGLLAGAVLAAGCGAERLTSVSAATPRLQLQIVAGDVQVGPGGRELPEALKVQVLDQQGQPLPGVVVSYRVVSGGGSLYAGTASTDAQGRAADWWTLGPASADTQRVEVRAVDPVTAERKVYATFRAVTSPAEGGFTVALAPAALSVAAGGSVAAVVDVGRGTYAGPVTLAATGAPAGVAVSFAPASVDGVVSVASVTVGAGVAPGSYPIAVTGSAPGWATRSATLSLTVTAAVSGRLSSGQAHAGRIARAGQLDTWTFTATRGDYVDLSMAETGATSSDFTPWIRIAGPTGEEIENVYGSAVARVGRNAPATGTYTVTVGTNDYDNNGTSDYRLTFLSAPGTSVVPAGDEGGAIARGSTQSGTITPGDVDQWTFTATRGDYVALTIAEGKASSDFTPWIRLVGPTGEQVTSASGSAAAQIDLNAPTSGTYTVLVGTYDSGDDGTGEYQLRLTQVVPGASVSPAPGDDGGRLTAGYVHTGSIQLGDLDEWTFDAAKGDYVALGIAEGSASSDFAPWIRLIGPTGEQVASEFGSAAAGISRNLPVAGVYTVIVGTYDSGDDGTGDYRVSLLRAPDANVVPSGDQGGALTNGATHAGSITLGDRDHWTFHANRGDYVAIALGEGTASSDFTPWIRLIGPTGEEVGNDAGSSAAQIARNLPTTGTYTVLVGTYDSGDDGTGEYRLTLALAPAAFAPSTGDEGGAMKPAVPNVGTITLGDVDQWTFTATQGVALAVRVVKGSTASSEFTPWIRLIGPTGEVVGSDYGSTAAEVRKAAPSTGTYTVIVGTYDSGGDGTGTYELTVTGASAAQLGTAAARARP